MNAAITAAGAAILLLGAVRGWLAFRTRKVGAWNGTEVIVRRRGRFRELVLARGDDALVQSRQDVHDPLSAGDAYIEGFHLGVSPGARRALFLGGGAMIGPRQFEFRYPEMTIDVVENNPVVVEAATRYFGFETSHRLALHLDDAASFVADAARYDVIVLDVYDAHGVPAELMNAEFCAALRRISNDDGTLVVNLAHLEALDEAQIVDALARAFPTFAVTRHRQYAFNTLAIFRRAA